MPNAVLGFSPSSCASQALAGLCPANIFFGSFFLGVFFFLNSDVPISGQKWKNGAPPLAHRLGETKNDRGHTFPPDLQPRPGGGRTTRCQNNSFFLGSPETHSSTREGVVGGQEGRGLRKHTLVKMADKGLCPPSALPRKLLPDRQQMQRQEAGP